MRLNPLLAGLGIVLVGCHSSTEPTIVSGSLSFSYTGAGATSATTYSASGGISPLMTSLGRSAWAVGSTPSGELDILAVVPKTSTTWDIVEVSTFAARTVVGAYTVDPNCQALQCALVTLATDSDGSSAFTNSCALTSGTVTISAITASNATGTFSGSGTCSTKAGVISAFTVTNGTFNVGLTPSKP